MILNSFKPFIQAIHRLIDGVLSQMRSDQNRDDNSAHDNPDCGKNVQHGVPSYFFDGGNIA